MLKYSQLIFKPEICTNIQHMTTQRFRNGAIHEVFCYNRCYIVVTCVVTRYKIEIVKREKTIRQSIAITFCLSIFFLLLFVKFYL